MTRDSIHISMSEPLRRARVRPRLQSLADATGLPVALVGARALTIGLGHLEGDLRLIFTGSAAPAFASGSNTAPTAEPPSITASGTEPPRSAENAAAASSTTAALDTIPIRPAVDNEPPNTTAVCDEPSSAAAPTADTQPAPIAHTVEQPIAPTAAVKVEPTPRADLTGRVSTKDAARSLKLTTAALQQRIGRSPDLRRHAQRVGRDSMWDLAGLRQALAK